MFKRQYDFNTLRIIDFGLAAYLDKKGRHFLKCGTPGYVAPEVVKGDESYGFNVDSFSCGAVFYFLLTGQHLFKGQNFDKVMKANKRC